MPTNIELASELGALREDFDASAQESDSLNHRLGALEERVDRFVRQVQSALNIVEDRG